MDKKTHLLKNQYKSLGLVLVLVFLSTAMHGQTIAQADNTYKQFIMMRSVDSISKDEIYMKSLECARAYKQVLINSPKGVENYDKSCMLLASLFNFLKAGAGYFSQARKDSAAVIFAREAVDLAMMTEIAKRICVRIATTPSSSISSLPALITLRTTRTPLFTSRSIWMSPMSPSTPVSSPI